MIVLVGLVLLGALPYGAPTSRDLLELPLPAPLVSIEVGLARLRPLAPVQGFLGVRWHRAWQGTRRPVSDLQLSLEQRGSQGLGTQGQSAWKQF